MSQSFTSLNLVGPFSQGINKRLGNPKQEAKVSNFNYICISREQRTMISSPVCRDVIASSSSQRLVEICLCFASHVTVSLENDDAHGKVSESSEVHSSETMYQPSNSCHDPVSSHWTSLFFLRTIVQAQNAKAPLETLEKSMLQHSLVSWDDVVT